MTTAGLLQQLPDIDQLTQARDLVQSGLDGVLRQVSSDPASFVQPLTDVLAQVRDQIPDVAGLIAPLIAQRGQLVSALPSGVEQQITDLLPLLNTADQSIAQSAIAPIIDKLRSGQGLNDLARDGLNLFLQQFLGQLPTIVGNTVSGDKRAAINAFLSAANNAGTPDAAAVATFLAEHLLGVPVAALDAVANVHQDFFSTLTTVEQAGGAAIDDLEQALAAQFTAAASQLEGLDPASASDWQAAQIALQPARVSLDSLHAALRSVPNVVLSNLGQLDLQRYKAALRQTLQALPTADGNTNAGRFASLEGIADDILEPLSRMTEILAETTPGDFTSQLRSTLDQLLGLFDTMAESVQNNPVFDVFDDLQQIVDDIAGAIRSIETALDTAIQMIVQAVAAIADQFNTVRQQIEAAFQTLTTTIEQIDVAALTQAINTLFEQLNAAIAAIPLEEFKRSLDQALSLVETLVNTLSEAVTAALAQLETLIGALDQIEFKAAAEPVISAIKAIKEVLSAINPNLLPDAVQALLREAIDAFEAQFNGDFEGYFQREVIEKLSEAFDEAAGAMREFVEQLQQKLREFVESVGKLDPSQLLEPVTRIFQQLSDALAGISGEQLLAPVRTLLNEARTTLQGIAPEALFAPIEQAFEQDVLGPVQRFKPPDLLQPLIAAFAPLQDLLNKLDFSEAFAGLGAAATDFLGTTQSSLSDALDLGSVPGTGDIAAQVQPVLGVLNPAVSMDDWTSVLDDMLSNYRPSIVLQPIQAALEPVENVLLNASDELLLATFGRLQTLSSATNVLSPATSSAIATRLTALATTLEQNQPATISAGLSSQYARMQTAMNRIAVDAVPGNLRPQYDAVRSVITALDPMTRLDRLNDAFASLPARIRQLAAGPLDLGDLHTAFGAQLSALGGLLPGFLSGELSPATIRDNLTAFSPTTLIEQIDQRFDAFLTAAQRFEPAIQVSAENFVDQLGVKLSELSPAAAFERFDQLFSPIRAAIADISPQAIAERLDQAYEAMLSSLGQVHPKVIREPAQALFNTALAKLEELQQAIVDTVIAGIDQALSRLRETLKALDPQALIISLGNLFGLIREALAAIQLEALLEHLIRSFDQLRADLQEILRRAASAFSQMVEAIPV